MLKGQKVVLREKRLSDAPEDYAWRCDPELARLDATPPLQLPFSAFLASYAEELKSSGTRRRRFAIDTLDDKHIGNCMYYAISKKSKEAEVGIMIGDRDYWDQGYGTDAICTLAQHIFQNTDMERLYLNTLDWNFRAQRCFQKCGFVPCNRSSRPQQEDTFVVMELRRSWLNQDET